MSIADKTRIEFHPNSPGIHAGVIGPVAHSAEHIPLRPPADGRGRNKPRFFAPSATRRPTSRLSLGRRRRSAGYPGVNAGAIRAAAYSVDSDRCQCRAARRGGVYIAVLGVAMITSMIGL